MGRRRPASERHRGVGHRHGARRHPGKRCARGRARLDMGVVDRGRERHFARDDQIGQRPRRHGIDAHVLLAQPSHEILAVGQHQRRDEVRGGRNRARHRHASAPFGAQQIVVALGRARRRDHLRVEADAGIGFAHHGPMTLGLDCACIERRRLRRVKGLQDIRVADEDQPFGGELEHVELPQTDAVFLHCPARDIGLRAALHGDIEKGIFPLEPADERFDLRACRVEKETALALGTRFQHRLAIASRIIRDRLDGIRGLRGGVARPSRERRSKNSTQLPARYPHEARLRRGNNKERRQLLANEGELGPKPRSAGAGSASVRRVAYRARIAARSRGKRNDPALRFRTSVGTVGSQPVRDQGRGLSSARAPSLRDGPVLTRRIRPRAEREIPLYRRRGRADRRLEFHHRAFETEVRRSAGYKAHSARTRSRPCDQAHARRELLLVDGRGALARHQSRGR